MEETKIGAIILAGAPTSDYMGPDNADIPRAMVQINGKTMLQYVVDALSQSQSVGQIVAIGYVEADGVDKILEPADNMVDNMARAVPHVDSGEQILIACADIPMLTPAAVDDFVGRAREVEANLIYPIIEKGSLVGEYAEAKRTFVKTGDGTFTGGNLAIISRDFFSKNSDAIARAHILRKRPFALAEMIGYGVLFRFLLAQIYPPLMPLNIIEKAAGKVLGTQVKALISKYPEIGQDVDKYEDIEMAQSILAKRKAPKAGAQ